MKGISAILALGLIAMPAMVSAQEIMSVSNMDPTCGRVYPGASPKGEALKKVTFVNTRADLVWPAWINQGGFVSVVPEEVPPGGGKFSTYTRVGHKWMMIDGATWECLTSFTISEDAASYTIE